MQITLENFLVKIVEIVEGVTNGKREYRVYINMNWVDQFETYQEALDFKLKYEQMLKEKASDDKD